MEFGGGKGFIGESLRVRFARYGTSGFKGAFDRCRVNIGCDVLCPGGFGARRDGHLFVMPVEGKSVLVSRLFLLIERTLICYSDGYTECRREVYVW